MMNNFQEIAVGKKFRNYTLYDHHLALAELHEMNQGPCLGCGQDLRVGMTAWLKGIKKWFA
jgi:hypothetical protein